MSTLHIEHEISDFTTWRNAFDRFAAVRAQSGVLAERVQRPADDENYVVLQLDFAEARQATSFLRFLEQNVWSTPANSPALVGSPSARVLETVR